jgi:arsenate reductase
MAEGWVRHLRAGFVTPYSAGVAAKKLDPLAVSVMAEAGVDISSQRSKHVSEVMHVPFDFVITVCSHARETCPFFPGKAQQLHVEFDDPPFLTRGMVNEQDRLRVYRRVRDEIRAFVETLPESLLRGSA